MLYHGIQQSTVAVVFVFEILLDEPHQYVFQSPHLTPLPKTDRPEHHYHGEQGGNQYVRIDKRCYHILEFNH